MAETIPCPINAEDCSCGCNCVAYFPDRLMTAESIYIDGNDYSFSYIITDPAPQLSNITFCIECPTSVFETSFSNTAISVIGNPNSGTPVTYTVCGAAPCPDNSYTAEFLIGEESKCCSYQGIKLNLFSAETITEIRFVFTFTLPAELSMGYSSGVLKIKYGNAEGVVNYFCMPGCSEKCDKCRTICEMWKNEEEILKSKKNSFIHYAQEYFPDSLDLSTLTLNELEYRIRQLVKLEKNTAKLNCKIAKVLEKLNAMTDCDRCCIP